MAAAVGSCAHLVALRRTASGACRLEDAVTLDALEDCDPDARDAYLLPADSLLASMPRLDVDADTARSLMQGRTVPAAATPGPYRGYRGGRFLGVVDIDDAFIRPRRMARTD